MYIRAKWQAFLYVHTVLPPKKPLRVLFHEAKVRTSDGLAQYKNATTEALISHISTFK